MNPADAPTLERHRWNTGFEWVDRTGPRRRLTADEVTSFDRDGHIVLRNVIDPADLSRVRDACDEADSSTDALLRDRADERIFIAERGAITFSPHLVTRSEVARDFAAGPVFADLCADLVGPDVNLYWDQAVYKQPEKPRRFPWHQDNGYTYVEPQQYLTCWVPLTDATEHNGCPQVVSGVHRLGTLRHTYVEPLGWECFREAPGQPEVCEVAAGDVIVFSSLTPHLTGPNTTDDVRKAYILQYAPVGAMTLSGDPAAGPPIGRVAQDDPSRQFPILRAGVSPRL